MITVAIGTFIVDDEQLSMFHPRGPTFWELARQALSSTERGYDLLAPKFDYTPFRTPDFLLGPVAEVLAALGPFASAIDLGCGTGAGIQAIRSLCTDRIVGIDFSRGMLEVCRRQLEPLDAGGPRIELVRGQLLTMPFAQSFDLAICFGVLGHIVDSPRFLAEAARILRPGGKLVFLTSHLPPLTSPRRWLSRAFNGAMHIRNALVQPPFHMYYLTFLLPEIGDQLKSVGFEVEGRGLPLGDRYDWVRLVIARRGHD